MLRATFVPKRAEVARDWRKFRNGALYDISSLNIFGLSDQKHFRVIRSRRMRWAGHLARLGGGGGMNYAEFYLGHLKEERIWKIWAKMGT
jgi:hypothetical protein